MAEGTVFVNAAGGAVQITLPSVTVNKVYTIKKIDNSSNGVTIVPTGADTIDALPLYTLSTYNDSVTLFGDYTGWLVTVKPISAISFPYHNHQAGVDTTPTLTEGTGPNIGKFSMSSADVWFFTDSGRHTMVLKTIVGGSWLSPTNDVSGYVCADSVTSDWIILSSIDSIDYIRYVPMYVVFKRTGSNTLHHQNISLTSRGEVCHNHHRLLTANRYARYPGTLESFGVDGSLNISASGGDVWAGNFQYSLLPITTNTRQTNCENTGTGWAIVSHLVPVLYNTRYNGPSGYTTLTDGYWTSVYLYRGIENQDHMYVVTSTKQHQTMELAKADNTIPAVPELVSSHTMFFGRIIFQKNMTSGFICESAFTSIFAASTAVTNHNGLSGLAADDHLQYQLRSEKGAIGGYAGLDATQKVDIINIPTGATSSTVCIGNDSRLSDARTPIAHAVNSSTYGYGDATLAGHARAGIGLTPVDGTFNVNYGNISTTACRGDDGRLSDDRTASGIRSATTIVSVSTADAPTVGRVLMATANNAATWQLPIANGTIPPADPIAGQGWFNMNTGYNIMMSWDPTRNLWLSVDTLSIVFSRNTNNAGSQYLRTGDSSTCDVSGTVMPINATAVGWTASAGSSTTVSYVLRTRNSATGVISGNLATLTQTAAWYSSDTALNVNCNAINSLVVYLNTGSASFPCVTVFYKYRW
jgi:hypothetical protein